MSTRALLHKELREQAPVLIVTAIGGLLGCAGTAALASTYFVDSPDFPFASSLCLTAVIAIACGCDIGTRDRGDGALEWLRRQPTSLAGVATAKIAVLMAAVILTALFGVTVATAASEVLSKGGGIPQSDVRVTFSLVGLLALSLWSAAASTFLPRGFLAAPGGVCLFALVASPTAFEVIGFGVGELPLALWIGCTLGAGALAFATGFVLGARSEWPTWKRGLAVLAAGALGMLPAWIDSGVTLYQIHTLDVMSPEFEEWGFIVHEDGRHLFVNVRDREPTNHAVILDLETGHHQVVGGINDHFDTWNERMGAAAPFAKLEKRDGTIQCIGVDGLPIESDQPYFGDPFPSSSELGIGAKWTVSGPAGDGFVVVSKGNRHGFVDRRSGHVITGDMVADDKAEHGFYRGWLSDEVWLFSSRSIPTQRSGLRFIHSATWWTCHPGDAQLQEVHWLSPEEYVVGVLGGGRVLVTNRDTLWSIDALDGHRRELPQIDGASYSSLRGREFFDPDGARQGVCVDVTIDGRAYVALVENGAKIRLLKAPNPANRLYFIARLPNGDVLAQVRLSNNVNGSMRGGLWRFPADGGPAQNCDFLERR